MLMAKQNEKSIGAQVFSCQFTKFLIFFENTKYFTMFAGFFFLKFFYLAQKLIADEVMLLYFICNGGCFKN